MGEWDNLHLFKRENMEERKSHLERNGCAKKKSE